MHGSHRPLARPAQDTTASAPINSSRPRRADKFDRYAWRDAVYADAETPDNVKSLVFGIAKYVDGESGEAHPSTITLAKVCGRSETWVRKMIPKLQNSGWADVERGSQGRGEDHCNRYRINPEKPARVEVPKPHPPAVTLAEKVPKPHTGCEEPQEDSQLRVPNTINSECAAPAARTARMDRVPDVTGRDSFSITESTRLTALSVEIEDQNPTIDNPLETPSAFKGDACNNLAGANDAGEKISRVSAMIETTLFEIAVFDGVRKTPSIAAPANAGSPGTRNLDADHRGKKSPAALVGEKIPREEIGVGETPNFNRGKNSPGIGDAANGTLTSHYFDDVVITAIPVISDRGAHLCRDADDAPRSGKGMAELPTGLNRVRGLIVDSADADHRRHDFSSAILPRAHDLDDGGAVLDQLVPGIESSRLTQLAAPPDLAADDAPRSGKQISVLKSGFADQGPSSRTLIRVETDRPPVADLDESAKGAHLSGNDNAEDQAMYVDANECFPQAGRRPRELRPEHIAERQAWLDKNLPQYPNQPRHEADEVAALITIMLHDRRSYGTFVAMFRSIERDVATGRRKAGTVPSLKNCLLRNWRAVHGVGAEDRIAA